MLDHMTRAEQIRERLAEIEAELAGAPRRVRKPLDSIENIGADIDNFTAVEDWPARREALAKERRELQHEYDRLPKSAKGDV